MTEHEVGFAQDSVEAAVEKCPIIIKGLTIKLGVYAQRITGVYQRRSCLQIVRNAICRRESRYHRGGNAASAGVT